ncbi:MULTISPECIES: class I SAM-dependent methyltransferase [Rhizobium]|uniref:class I SAM-dependent methyltransferase n=1 Tax=Rhizobium TaxID=379 RepID=UPI001B336502|nr:MULTISPECIES: class I SAM-dependent methyltransferase [Rhizobium]MBX4907841.1 class I SAM-dependent methyltransferase [Rhizobium bangladeshense]MBX5215607.1 class I SAM-dependent methyltransferase [Rhizobium sp. NLR9a]MBX5221466.1 class I SAM-dependent methyltransferase [Rhizobium sp. NLR8a]MBX5232770.1 class I SAM-dependent methyltransferase [Rhizobium sp. NLR4a]MBX5238247.1 class I SAM-dependent methyltransferase [Rhizobium sp. NLR22b]
MAQPLFSLDGQSLITPQSVSNQFPSPHHDNEKDLLRTAEAEFAIVINIAMQRFGAGKDLPGAVKWLIGQLHDVRQKFGAAVWQKLIPFIQAHPSAKILQQCPFTRWSFEKPRGYSGDAGLIDFIYGHPAVAEQVARSTLLGLDIFEYTINAPGPVAVRERRDILTRYVDDTAARTGSDTEVLAIAAGHLREAETSKALAEGRLKRWVALDQDPQSIGSIASQFHGTSVEPIDGSVRGLLARKHQLGTFDLIYAAGLYDYLADKVAIRLTQICMEMLKPGGVFLFANFSDEMADDGYMESYMNWELLQRSNADMWRIANAGAAENTVEKTVWFGANRNIIYATIRRLS